MKQTKVQAAMQTAQRRANVHGSPQSVYDFQNHKYDKGFQVFPECENHPRLIATFYPKPAQ